MAATYGAPGVYVEEKPSGSMPLQGVGTAVAAFVGFTRTYNADAGDPSDPEGLTRLMGDPEMTTFLGGRPSSASTSCPAASIAILDRVAMLALAICGVRTTFSRLSSG